jgi:hypothetical protein
MGRDVDVSGLDIAAFAGERKSSLSQGRCRANISRDHEAAAIRTSVLARQDLSGSDEGRYQSGASRGFDRDR